MNFIFSALAVFLLVPVAVLCAECVAALLPCRKIRKPATAQRPTLAVLVPAHNEEAVLGETLRSLMPQLRKSDRVVVVADNCVDATADIARRHGATVIERHDHARRGKGYALDFGMRHLDHAPPQVLIMMDADCLVHDGAVDALLQQVAATGRPAQACYLMEQPRQAKPKDLVSALAFMVKNWVRPSGLVRLGLPCLLTGTGMAFPWPVIRRAKLASGNIVEDMQLGLDLALEGHAPLFCGAARVTGRLPTQIKVAYKQRTRWEHGHLQTLIRQVPRLFKVAIARRKLQPLALAFELSVPPLSLLVMMLAAMLGCSLVGAKLGATPTALQIVSGAVAVASACLFGAWFKYGRDSLPFASLMAAPLYVAWKVPMYLAFVFRPQREWVRTDRSDAVPTPPAHPFEMPPAGVMLATDLNRDIPAAASTIAAGTATVAAALAPSMSVPAFDRAADAALAEAAGPAIPAPAFPCMRADTFLCGRRGIVSAEQCVEHMLRKLESLSNGMVVRPLTSDFARCRLNVEFADLIAAPDLVIAHGAPLTWTGRLRGRKLTAAPVSGADLVWNLISASAACGRSVFLLGDEHETTQDAAATVRDRYPAIRLAGWYSAPDGFDSDEEAVAHMARAISSRRPDVVLVALDSPRREQIIRHLNSALPTTWWLAVGDSFGFLCDDRRRAPLWLSRAVQRWSVAPVADDRTAAAGAAVVPDRQVLADSLPLAVSLMGSSAVKRLTRILSKSGGQEKALEAVLAGGGIEDVAVAETDREPMAICQQSATCSSANPACSATLANVPNAHAAVTPSAIDQGGSSTISQIAATSASTMVYQSFLQGFASGWDDSSSFSGSPAPEAGLRLMRPPCRSVLQRLKAVVLLGGSVRPNRLSNAIGRSILDLPLEDGRSILWHWRDAAIELRRSIGLDHLPVRVLVDQRSARPIAPMRGTHVTVQIERDSAALRGTGGVLADLVEELADDDVILVANGAQALLRPATELVAALAERDGDVTLVSHDDGTPSGMMLVRCAALRQISPAGYVDFKEQALPRIAKRFNVLHVPYTAATGLPVRSLGEYIVAIQNRCRQRLGHPIPSDPFAEDCRPTFAVIEEGAVMHPSAQLHDAVVLRGANVGQDGLVVRSLVCSGVVLEPGEQVIDQLVAGEAVASR